ncbi:MAG TPA: PadR family transcriptional regulator [Armatimonadetes bacterium]|nr:PadR family transcriptional regulator [Armatimonadota bacterium]
MRRRYCHRHRRGPCSCMLGNIYRFIEPTLLLLLKARGRAYGYELLEDIPKFNLTDSEIEPGAVYRTLRQLEAHGYVISEWDTSGAGPARRYYRLTSAGEQLLSDWAAVIEVRRDAMTKFLRTFDKLSRGSEAEEE